MRLFRWQGQSCNFGDELNVLLWPRLLPGFFDEDEADLFLGIGSVLDARHDPAGRKVVAGAGYGGYEVLPFIDANWTIHWVRGPRTAAALGLPPATGIGDPAMLVGVAGLADPTSPGDGGMGFMPHFESAERGAWAAAAGAAGLTYIDPRGDPAGVLASIRRCRLLLSEAMHGVIVADALRVPWIAIEPRAPVHRAKWRDWSDTLDLVPRFHAVPASSLLERVQASRVARYHAGRQLAARHADRLRRIAAHGHVQRAGEALCRIAEAEPQLSAERPLDRCLDRMQTRLGAVRATRPCGPRHAADPRDAPAADALHTIGEIA